MYVICISLMYSLYTYVTDSGPPLDYWYILFSFSFHPHCFCVLFVWSLIFHSRNFLKMLENSGFFTVFKSEEPENLIISSVHRLGPIDLKIHRKVTRPGHSWDSLSVSLFNPLLWGDQISHWKVLFGQVTGVPLVSVGCCCCCCSNTCPDFSSCSSVQRSVLTSFQRVSP